jgi:predicted  nucleic acid-binding Zn-ribbon protein
LIAAADEAADLASEAQTIADLSGTSVENASALSAVLRDNTNIEAGDLMDIMAQVTGALASNPSLMQQLGIKMDTVRQGPFATFIAAVDAWNSGQLTGTEKMLAGAQLFGEEGLRQIGALTTALDTTLADAVAGVAENRLIHPEDVVSAQELKRQISGLTADFQTMAVNIGQQVVPVLADMLGQLEDAGGLVNTIAEIGQTGTARSVWDFINEFPSAKFVEINDQLNAAGVTAEDFRKNLFDLNDVMALLAAGIPAEVIEGATLTADAQKYLAEQVAETTDAAEDEADALEDTSKTLQSYTDRLETSIDALELQADAQREAAAASEEQADALLAANDTFYANQKAIRAARDAVHDYNDVAADSESSADDQAEALQNVALAAADVAATEVEALRRIRETTGATVSQTEALDITNRSLLNQAANLQGPARDAIVAHIARLNGIPIETITNILAIADAGNIGVAEATLDEASRTRTATVKADTDNASVANTDKELNNLARRRDAQIAVELLYKNLPTSTFLGTYGVRSRGASAPAPPPAAVTPYGAGIAGGGDVYNLTLPRGTRPDDMARALTRHARRNGRPYAFR